MRSLGTFAKVNSRLNLWDWLLRWLGRVSVSKALYWRSSMACRKCLDEEETLARRPPNVRARLQQILSCFRATICFKCSAQVVY